jgi:hypothetical protein
MTSTGVEEGSEPFIADEVRTLVGDFAEDDSGIASYAISLRYVSIAVEAVALGCLDNAESRLV